MGKRLPNTPRSKIRAALRALFLRSREHQAALKNAGRTCQKCGRKASVAKGRECKVHVHHLTPIQWEVMFTEVYKWLLCHPSMLTVLCEACHKEEHEHETILSG